MKYINFLRVLHLLTLSVFITLLIWFFRYMWFSIQTVPQERVETSLLAFFFFVGVSYMVEQVLNDIKN